jgi:hypothetical protein
VLTSIQFNNEFLAWSNEVNNVIANGMLFAEMDVSHPMRTQMGPEFSFCRSHFAVKLFRAPEDFGCGAFMGGHGPPPDLPQFEITIGGGEILTWVVTKVFIQNLHFPSPKSVSLP